MAATGSAEFGVWLRERIGTRKYGQVATYVGVSTSTVSRWVTGESAPEYRNRLLLAEYLKVEPAEVHRFFPDARPAGHPSDWLRDASGFDMSTGAIPATERAGRPSTTILMYRSDGGVDVIVAENAREEASVRRVAAAIEAWRAAGAGEGDAGGGDGGAGDPG